MYNFKGDREENLEIIPNNNYLRTGVMIHPDTKPLNVCDILYISYF